MNLRRLVVLVFVAALCAIALAGCRSKECAKMVECCDRLVDVEGVGEVCESRARSVEDRKTCETVLEAVIYMFEERDEEPPEVCRISGDS